MTLSARPKSQSNKFSVVTASSPKIVLTPHRRLDCIQKALSEAEWRAIVIAQSFRCFYCGESITAKTAERDHIFPFSQGGCSCSGNRVAACVACNQLKNARTLEEFLADRPQFLQIVANFSTRIVLLERTPALFWNRLSETRNFFNDELPRLVAAKSFEAPAMPCRLPEDPAPEPPVRISREEMHRISAPDHEEKTAVRFPKMPVPEIAWEDRETSWAWRTPYAG